MPAHPHVSTTTVQTYTLHLDLTPGLTPIPTAAGPVKGFALRLKYDAWPNTGRYHLSGIIFGTLPNGERHDVDIYNGNVHALSGPDWLVSIVLHHQPDGWDLPVLPMDTGNLLQN
ncbi:hypothetical protein [Kitasatospora sp. NPDC059327]|uniref:hypothetical protein n=1 Tax=Kitasatospora sp. NPDC059327 TaxID=3346803 RepID=UPI00368DF2F6